MFTHMHLGVVVVAKYLVLFGFTGETIKRFVANPPTGRRWCGELAESAGGSLESYYWMFGQYDGAGSSSLPDSQPWRRWPGGHQFGAFTRFETHELIESSDLTAIAERAKGIATSHQAPDRQTVGC